MQRLTALRSFADGFSQAERRGLAALAAFALGNAVKVALFTLLTIEFNLLSVALYKAAVGLAVSWLVFAALLRLGGRAALLGAWALQTVYLFANLAYFLYFHRYFHLWQTVQLFGEGLEALDTLWVVADARLAVVLLDLPLLLLLARQAPAARSALAARPRARRGAALACLAVLLGAELLNLATGKSLVHTLQAPYFGETAIVKRYGTVVNNLVDLWKLKDEATVVASLDYGEAVFEAPARAPRGVLAIQAESLDAGVIGLRYRGELVAPALTALAARAVYFPYTLSYHAGGGTSDAEFAALNGVEPLDNFAALKLRGYDFPNALPRRFRRAGLPARAFHGNRGDFFNRNVAFPKLGFGAFHDLFAMGLPERGWGAADHEVFAWAADLLAAEPGPAFTLVITMSGHGPFTNVRHYFSDPAFDPVADPVERDYLNSVRYLDQALEAFLARLEALPQRPAVFLYGDHSSNVKGAHHAARVLEAEGGLMEFVPLLILPAGPFAPREERERVASFLDLSPTMLAAAGVGGSLRTRGADLLATPFEAPTVRFKHRDHDRQELMERLVQRYGLQAPVAGR